jgi:hypothetical protein
MVEAKEKAAGHYSSRLKTTLKFFLLEHYFQRLQHSRSGFFCMSPVVGTRAMQADHQLEHLF